MNPQSVVAAYKNSEYTILAITDHFAVTYPWEEFSKLKPEDRIKQRIIDKIPKPSESEPMKMEELEFKDVIPGDIGMIAVQGNEISYKGHDINSYYNNYRGSDSNASLDSISAKNGVAVLNHPGRYKFKPWWYADLFGKYDNLVGLEVFNCGNRYPGDRQKWDSVLTLVTPTRSIWGFSNDDMHSMRDFGRNWNVFLLPELNEYYVRKTIENGTFYFINAPEGHKGPEPPSIESIKTNKRNSRINIESIATDSIIWISNGIKVGKGKSIQVTDLPSNCKYIRAELYGKAKSMTCTQPFRILSSRKIRLRPI